VRSGPRVGFRWTRSAILYAFDRWHRRYLCAPTLDDRRYASEDHPSAITVQRVFGSWNRAVRAAGLRARGPDERRDLGPLACPPERSRGGSAVRWPRERIIDAIRAWEREHGSPPALREWRRSSASHPAAATVQRVFGSWNESIAAAGFVPRPPSLSDRPRELTHRRCAATGRWLPGSRLSEAA
jgi:Homing endonuclease associated repeat